MNTQTERNTKPTMKHRLLKAEEVGEKVIHRKSNRLHADGIWPVADCANRKVRTRFRALAEYLDREANGATVAVQHLTGDTTMRLLTMPKASERLGLKPATVRFWIWTRKIEHVKVACAVRLKEDTIEELIQRGTVPARSGR